MLKEIIIIIILQYFQEQLSDVIWALNTHNSILAVSIVVLHPSNSTPLCLSIEVVLHVLTVIGVLTMEQCSYITSPELFLLVLTIFNLKKEAKNNQNK